MWYEELRTKEYPLPIHPTWWTVDSSKLIDYLTCPRMYFWKYVRGWRSAAPNNHLVFGQAIHHAMEHLLTTDYEDDNVREAYQKFLAHYRQFFDPSTDSTYDPKTPANALAMLTGYAIKYRSDLADYSVKHTEIGGYVPIAEDKLMGLRMDSILYSPERGYFSLEHKTGSQLGRVWRDQWQLAIQLGTYTHTLYGMYPAEEVYGICVNGLFFRKKSLDLERVWIRKTPAQMQTWLNTVNYWYTLLVNDFMLLTMENESRDTMWAFPMNPTNCTKYFGCEYHDFCIAYQNPFHADMLPVGFEAKFWDPFEEPVRHTLDDSVNNNLLKTGVYSNER